MPLGRHPRLVRQRAALEQHLGELGLLGHAAEDGDRSGLLRGANRGGGPGARGGLAVVPSHVHLGRGASVLERAGVARHGALRGGEGRAHVGLASAEQGCAHAHARGAERRVQPERLDVKSARVATDADEELHGGFRAAPRRQHDQRGDERRAQRSPRDEHVVRKIPRARPHLKARRGGGTAFRRHRSFPRFAGCSTVRGDEISRARSRDVEGVHVVHFIACPPPRARLPSITRAHHLLPLTSRRRP